MMLTNEIVNILVLNYKKNPTSHPGVVRLSFTTLRWNRIETTKLYLWENNKAFKNIWMILGGCPSRFDGTVFLKG